MVEGIAYRFAGRNNHMIDDVKSEARTCLWESIPKYYEENPKCALSTYIYRAAKRTIVDFLRSEGGCITKPVFEAKSERLVSKNVDKMAMEMGRLPSVFEFFDEHGKKSAELYGRQKFNTYFDDLKTLDLFVCPTIQEEVAIPEKIKNMLDFISSGLTLGDSATRAGVNRDRLVRFAKRKYAKRKKAS